MRWRTKGFICCHVMDIWGIIWKENFHVFSSFFLAHKAHEGNCGAVGLRSTHVNRETCEAATQETHSMPHLRVRRRLTGSRLFVSAEQLGERRSHFFLRSLFRTSSPQLNNLLYFLPSIHIFNTDKCSELICLCRHDSCNCSLTHSWIWNHSDLIGSFYSNVSSEASGKKKKKAFQDYSEPYFPGESTLFSLLPSAAGPLNKSQSKSCLYFAPKTPMSLARRMNRHDSASVGWTSSGFVFHFNNFYKT